MNIRLPLSAALIFQLFTLYGQDERGPLNEHTPSWMTLGAQVRYRGEGTQDGSPFLLERYRFDVGIQPLPWMAFFGEFQDARAANAPNQGSGFYDRTDIRQAYVRLGREDGLWDVKVGRQRFVFGSERLIGASEWVNSARVFDGVRLGIHNKLDRFDIFSSSVVVNDADNWDHHQQGNNFHGMYGSFGSWLKGSKIEPYLLLRTNHRLGNSNNWTYGLRGAGAIGPKWNYEAEALGQRGHLAGSQLSAWGGMVQVQRHFRHFALSPTLLGEANYASGDHRAGDGVVNTLDQLYPTNHGIYGITDQVGRRNTKNIRGGVWLHPEKWLTLKGETHYFWLANSHDGLYAANGAMIGPAVAGGAAYTDIGPEVDVLADVKLSRYYDIGAQFGHLFPGRYLETYMKGGGRSFYAFFVDFHL